ncbi:MAG TPA: hypothetical protein PLX65_03285 [Accumulibacter sp.]|nr:hypothetical protein [Accumulibacter sp.]
MYDTVEKRYLLTIRDTEFRPETGANDTPCAFPGRQPTLTGVTHFRHGTDHLEASSLVHFLPEANCADDAVCADMLQTRTGTLDACRTAWNGERRERTPCAV